MQIPNGPTSTHVPEDDEDGDGDGDGVVGSGLGDSGAALGDGVGPWPTEVDGSGVGSVMVEGSADGVDPVPGEPRPCPPVPLGELPRVPDWWFAGKRGVPAGAGTCWPGPVPPGPMSAAWGCRGAIVSVTNDIRMKTIAVDTRRISGGRSSSG
jgi:hypothetical protein